jgi:hypothetical protein
MVENVNDKAKLKLTELKISASDCIATNLQFMFTLMKETIRKSIDPNFFIKFCGLDENMQQVKNNSTELKLYENICDSQLINRLTD